MRKVRAIAIAAKQENPLQLFFASVANFSVLATDFMYGTPKRTRATIAFALGLLALSFFFPAQDLHAMAACPV